MVTDRVFHGYDSYEVVDNDLRNRKLWLKSDKDNQIVTIGYNSNRMWKEEPKNRKHSKRLCSDLEPEDEILMDSYDYKVIENNKEEKSLVLHEVLTNRIVKRHYTNTDFWYVYEKPTHKRKEQKTNMSNKIPTHLTKSDRRAINIAVVRNRELWHNAVKARNGVRRELGPSPRVCDNCFNGIVHDCLDGNRCQPKLKEYADRRIALGARAAEDHARVCFWNYQNALDTQRAISSGNKHLAWDTCETINNLGGLPNISVKDGETPEVHFRFETWHVALLLGTLLLFHLFHMPFFCYLIGLVGIPVLVWLVMKLGK